MDHSNPPNIKAAENGRGRTDRLRDRKCRTKGGELHCDKEEDARFAHVPEWLAVWRH